MKKSIIIIYTWLVILSVGFIYLCFTQKSVNDLEVGTPIPSCYLLDHSYYTHYDRDEDRVHQIEKEFAYYGTIHDYVKNPENNNESELSANTLYYVNRDVYVNQDNDSYIYVRMDKDSYSILYYNDATEKEVLKIIQANK
ncbi:MAG: hypothetical protein ACLUVC_02985 [Longibaculum sp.]